MEFNIISFLPLLGGIGMFLYGMSLLGSSLEKLAGAGLEKTLEKLTNSKLKGVALGAVVTGVIQSSAATTVMVVGFVNAGIMKLIQAVPVIMGANIGTTITGQILRLGDISEDNFILSLMKPSSFAPVVLCIGAGVLLFGHKRRTKDVGGILIGFGLLFLGMTTMEQTIAPLKDSPRFQQMFFMFRNPLLGMLLGAAVTAILQSSSASVGILQAISSTGTVTFSMAAPIIIGQNIGKCITVLLSSIGTNKKAKRAVCIHLLINIFGAALFMAGIYGFQAIWGFPFWDKVMTRGNIADFHTLFNVVTTLVLLPLCGLLIRISGMILKDNDLSKTDEELGQLDDIFLKTPRVALEQSRKTISKMGDAIVENFAISVGLLTRYDEKLVSTLQENEHFLDKSESVLGEYLVKITANNLTEDDNRLATEIMQCVSEFERIGDYCINISEVADYNHTQNIIFSEEGKRELNSITSAVKYIIDVTLDAYRTDDIVVCERVEPLEEVIDALKNMLQSRHVDRLQNGQCRVQAGISFIELLTNLERISDHCSNIAVHIMQKLSKDENFDRHERLREMHDGATEEYKGLYRYYESLYYDPVREQEKPATSFREQNKV